jgi:hypothetical protein
MTLTLLGLLSSDILHFNCCSGAVLCLCGTALGHPIDGNIDQNVVALV